jgi:acyl-CoA reductase-like NAD-dependent aldehyde dehydrogenase
MILERDGREVNMAIAHQQMAFIHGAWVPATGEEVLPVVDPSTEETVMSVRSAGDAEIDAACASAARALGPWSRSPLSERVSFVARIADAIEAQSEPIAALITSEVGTPINESRTLQVATAVRVFRRAAELAHSLELEESMDATKVLRTPIGVVACITPWNYPLYLIATKVAPALVAGCTVVLKPSEVAPGSAIVLADIARAIGLPPGVLNIVFGSGPAVGERILQDPHIDAVSFTGSTRAGARIAQLAGAGLKRVSLELGGKSPTIVLPDADVAVAVERTIAKCFQNAGQTCAALTRLIVPKSALGTVADMAARVARTYRLGDPHDAATRLGPVATSTQRERVREFLRTAASEGAELITGGPDAPADLPRGYFVQPSVYVAGPETTIARNEIFGPVLTLLAYSTEDEALQLAASGDYGLAGAVWARDPQEAEAFARKLRIGSISINGAATHPDAPFGGFRRSGFGRERGRYGIEEFLTTIAIHH